MERISLKFPGFLFYYKNYLNLHAFAHAQKQGSIQQEVCTNDSSVAENKRIQIFRILANKKQQTKQMLPEPPRSRQDIPGWCSHMTHRVGSFTQARVASWVWCWRLCRYGRNFFFFPSLKAGCFRIQVSLCNRKMILNILYADTKGSINTLITAVKIALQLPFPEYLQPCVKAQVPKAADKPYWKSNSQISILKQTNNSNNTTTKHTTYYLPRYTFKNTEEQKIASLVTQSSQKYKLRKKCLQFTMK